MPLLSGTFNGSQIAIFPTTPAPRILTWTMNNSVGTNVSPFTGTTQTQIWPGAWWGCKVEYAPLTAVQGDAVISFLAQCGGMASVFQLPDPMHTAPRGSVAGSPLANGNMGAGSRTFSIQGFTPNAVNVLLPGDLISPLYPPLAAFGYRAYKCLDTVSADSSGNATFNIWPPLREPVVTTEYLSFANVTCAFRLKTNSQEYSSNSEGRLYTITFECVEAL